MRFPTPSLSRCGARPCDGCSSHPMGEKGREMICDDGLSASRHHVARVQASRQERRGASPRRPE